MGGNIETRLRGAFGRFAFPRAMARFTSSTKLEEKFVQLDKLARCVKSRFESIARFGG